MGIVRCSMGKSTAQINIELPKVIYLDVERVEKIGLLKSLLYG
jgi:hypothetical protein